MSGSQDRSQPIRHDRTVLRPADHMAFFGALDRPAAPTSNLKTAAERHRKTVVSR